MADPPYEREFSFAVSLYQTIVLVWAWAEARTEGTLVGLAWVLTLLTMATVHPRYAKVSAGGALLSNLVAWLLNLWWSYLPSHNFYFTTGLGLALASTTWLVVYLIFP